jgi:hypothetical protein
MIYIFVLFMLACGYYTFTYGVSLWRDDANKLGAVGAAMAAIVGTIAPIISIFLKQ